MADRVDPRTGELVTTNYGWTKPTVGASVDAWGGYINTDLDGIDSTVKSVSNAIPLASSTTPAMNGAAAVGTGTTWARADHVHPVDTSRASVASVPLASSSNPTMNGAVAVGVGTTWARADHVHPVDTSRAAQSSLANYLPLAGGTLTGRVAGTDASMSIGYVCQSGQGGAATGNHFNIDFVAGASHLWIDSTNSGQIAFTSDYRIKQDVEPLPSMWETAKALKPIRYQHKDYTPPVELEKDASVEPMIVADGVERWGFIAHELQETLTPSAATGEKDSPTHIQSPNPWTVIATLTKALQEAMERIEALEAKP